MLTLEGNIHLFVHSFLHGPRLFHIWTEKHESNLSEMDIKVVIPALTNKKVDKDQKSFP